MLAASISAITMTAQSSQRIRSRSTPRARRWRTTTLAIGTRNAAIARPASTGSRAANASAGTGRLVRSRSTPGGHRDVVVAAAGRRDDHRQAGQRHQREAHLAGHAPAAGQEAAGREDQQQHRDRHRQERREPQQEPQREAHPGERPVRRRGRRARRTGPARRAPRRAPARPSPSRTRGAGRGAGSRARARRGPRRSGRRSSRAPAANSRPESPYGVRRSRATAPAKQRTRQHGQDEDRPSAGAVRSSPRHCDAPGRGPQGPRPGASPGERHARSAR